MLFDKVRNYLVHNILGLDDTPHRIALGVLLGFVIAFTPTLGFQIVLYVSLAALIRANKLSGLPVTFIMTPFTAVPIYWFVWQVGEVALGRHGEGEGLPSADALGALFEGKGLLEGIAIVFSGAFWERLGVTLVELGPELWVGALIVGFAVGIPFYVITVAAVRGFRRAKARYRDHHAPEPG